MSEAPETPLKEVATTFVSFAFLVDCDCLLITDEEPGKRCCLIRKPRHSCLILCSCDLAQVFASLLVAKVFDVDLNPAFLTRASHLPSLY